MNAAATELPALDGGLLRTADGPAAGGLSAPVGTQPVNAVCVVTTSPHSASRAACDEVTDANHK